MNRNYLGNNRVGRVEKHKSKPGIVDKTSKGPFSIMVTVYSSNYNQSGS